MKGLLELRDAARSNRDFQLSDRIRDLLVEANIDVMDSPDGPPGRSVDRQATAQRLGPSSSSDTWSLTASVPAFTMTMCW